MLHFAKQLSAGADGTAERFEPLDPHFNAAVLTMAGKVCPGGYDVVPYEETPKSLAELNAWIAHTGRIAVAREFSEDWRTIYADPETNWAFRAWHDWTHWHIQAELDFEGERKVWEQQCQDLAKIYGKHKWVMLLCFEIVSPILYQQRWGHFPANQRTFVETKLFQKEIW